MPLFNNMTLVGTTESGALHFANKEAHEELTVPKTLYEQLKKENKELKENSLPKDEIIEILGCDDYLDDEEILDCIRQADTYACDKDVLLNEKINQLKKENEKLKEENEKLKYQPKKDVVVEVFQPLAPALKLKEEIEKLKEENEILRKGEAAVLDVGAHAIEEVKKLKENLEKKDKQIARLVKNKNNREKQLVHIRTICENTDEYIEEKVSEKMDEYVVTKQNDKIDKLKGLLEEAVPFLEHAKGIASVHCDLKDEEKLNDLLIEIECLIEK